MLILRQVFHTLGFERLTNDRYIQATLKFVEVLAEAYSNQETNNAVHEAYICCNIYRFLQCTLNIAETQAVANTNTDTSMPYTCMKHVKEATYSCSVH